MVLPQKRFERLDLKLKITSSSSAYTATFQPTKPSRCPHQALTVVSSRRAGRWKKEKEEKRAISEQCL